MLIKRLRGNKSSDAVNLNILILHDAKSKIKVISDNKCNTVTAADIRVKYNMTLSTGHLEKKKK